MGIQLKINAMKKIILLLVSMLVAFAACEKPDSNTDPKNEDQEQGQEHGQETESDIAKQVLAILKQAGIDIPASDIKYQGVIRTAKRDLASDKFIGYYQICCVKSTVPSIYVLSYEAEHEILFEGKNYSESEIKKSNFKYIKCYTLPVPEQTVSVNQGYGRIVNDIPFSESFFTDFIKINGIYYGGYEDMYGEGTENQTVTNLRLLIDNGGTINIIAAEELHGEDRPSNYSSYRSTLYRAHDNNVILGAHCYSPYGELIYKVSPRSDLYTHSDDGNFGSWSFPLNAGKYLFVDFNGSNDTKSDPCDGYVRFIMDDLVSGDSDYVNSKSLGKNIFEQAKFKSASNGVYSFSMDATLYSGEKHTFAISVDTNKKTLTVDGKTTTAPLFTLDLLYGKWTIDKAKFTEQAEMTKWEHESTTIEFNKNGEFEDKGYFGNGSGTYTVEENDNTIHTYISNQPFITYEVTAYDKENNVAKITATIESTSQKVWLECGKCIGNDIGFINENDIKLVVAKLFSELRDFEIKREYAEHFILKNDRTKMTPESSIISDIWRSGYKAVSLANRIIKVLENSSLPDYFKYENLAQAQAVRSFIYYNMAVLWGDIPYVTEMTDTYATMNGIQRSSVKTILENELQAFERYHENVSSNEYYFTRNSNHMLNNEMAMYLKNAAKLVEFEKTGSSSAADIMWSIMIYNPGYETKKYRTYIKEIYGDEYQQVAPIYYNKHVDLYKEELDAHLDNPAEVDQLISNWGNADTFIYGRWAMLKRIGKAQAIVGCQDYQLLLPIPQSEVLLNPKISQNPGY